MPLRGLGATLILDISALRLPLFLRPPFPPPASSRHPSFLRWLGSSGARPVSSVVVALCPERGSPGQPVRAAKVAKAENGFDFGTDWPSLSVIVTSE